MPSILRLDQLTTTCAVSLCLPAGSTPTLISPGALAKTARMLAPGVRLRKPPIAATNAWLTLMAGFTTIQSLGSPTDLPLREAIAKGLLPGPRILTAVEPLIGRGEQTGTPDEIRAFVRKQKMAGADVIKIFASQSIRQGGGLTLVAGATRCRM